MGQGAIPYFNGYALKFLFHHRLTDYADLLFAGYQSNIPSV